MFLKRPLTFATPSVVNDTPQARAKVERDYKEIVQEVVRYLGAERVRELNAEVAIARRGRTPDERLNKLLLDEWDADAVQDPKEFAEAFYEKYPPTGPQCRSSQDAVEA